MSKELEIEAISIEELIKEKSISRIFRPRKNEICIELSDGMRFFVNAPIGSSLEFSVTGG
jgi:hypothetical protein